MAEEKELGMEATVTDAEIESLLQKADTLEAKLAQDTTQREYHIFSPVDKSKTDIFIG